MSSSAHVDDKTKYILILGRGPTQGLEHILTAENMYSINFTVTMSRKNSISNTIMSRKNSKRLVNR